MEGEVKVSKVVLQYYSQPERRRIKVHLSNGNTAYISPCCESWEIYDCYLNEKYIIIPIAKKFNAWLHGKDI